MKQFIYAENIGNSAIAPVLHNFIITCYYRDSELWIIDYADTAFSVDGKYCTCVEILTPSELYWTCLYLTDHMRYLAMVDEPMCDRVAEIMEIFDDPNSRFQRVVGFDKLIDWRNRQNERLYQLAVEKTQRLGGCE